jgi:hypothetical protein
MSDWHPIETAPRDGSIILLTHAGRTLAGYYGLAQAAMQVESDKRHPWEFLDETNGTNAVTDPTHWMPLPSPAKESEPI